MNPVHELKDAHVEAIRLLVDNNQATFEFALLALPVFSGVVHAARSNAIFHGLPLVTNLLAPGTFAEAAVLVHLAGKKVLGVDSIDGSVGGEHLQV